MYAYQTLEDGHFRLLTLVQPTGDERVHFSLTHHPVEACPKFYAISYSWEGQTPSQTAICNGEDLKITPTLESFLKILLDANEYGPFWVDAISIRQDDATEKASQVMVLDKYFTNAEAVYAWLGPSTEAIDNFMHQLPSHVAEPQPTESSGFKRLPIDRWLRLKEFPGEIRKVRPPIPSTELDLEVLYATCGDILRRNWFMRVWILQEAILNESVRMYCGRSSCDLEDLCTFVKMAFNRIPVADESQPSGRLFVFRLADLKASWKQKGGLSLGLLKAFCGDREVSLDVDRVYGLLGAVHQLTRQNIQVNYSQEAVTQPWRCFLDAGLESLNSDVRMGDLQSAGLDRQKPNSHLPSWCADFLPHEPTCAALGNVWQYQAGGGMKRENGGDELYSEMVPETLHQPHPWFACSKDRRMILMSGRLIGTVAGDEPSMPTTRDSANTADYHHRVLEWLRAWVLSCGQFNADEKPLVSHSWTSAVWNSVAQFASVFTRLMQTLDIDDHVEDKPPLVRPYRYQAVARCLIGNHLIGEELGTDPNRDLRYYEYDPPLEVLLQRLNNTIHILGRLDDPNDFYGLDAFSSTDDHRRVFTRPEVVQCFEHLQRIDVFMGDRRPLHLLDRDGRWRWIGVGPSAMEKGDLVVVFRYTNVPFVLRRTNDIEGRYALVGEAYVEGLMNGEAFLVDGSNDNQEFWIE